jgi:hypothetical protein
MLQVFHVDVVKVDRDVAYVAMAIQVYCVYCKRLFQIFQLFQTDVARVLSGCCICSHLSCKCFIRLLHMFLRICCKCFI